MSRGHSRKGHTAADVDTQRDRRQAHPTFCPVSRKRCNLLQPMAPSSVQHCSRQRHPDRAAYSTADPHHHTPALHKSTLHAVVETYSSCALPIAISSGWLCHDVQQEDAAPCRESSHCY